MPRAGNPREDYPEDYLKLIRDLEAQRTELEMQNEELRRARTELEESREKYIEFYDFAPVGTSPSIIGALSRTSISRRRAFSASKKGPSSRNP